jgi:hypothetical protein
MKRNTSIIKVDTRHHREIARDNWGLTKEQMVGMHVHHRIPVSRGGTDDASNLYVCSPYFHKNLWHDGKEFVIWAHKGAAAAHSKKQKDGKSVLAVRIGKLGGAASRDKGAGIHDKSRRKPKKEKILKTAGEISVSKSHGGKESHRKGVGAHNPLIRQGASQKGSLASRDSLSKPVAVRKIGGGEWERFDSSVQAAVALGVHKSNLCNVCNNRRSSVGGYVAVWI